MKNYTLFGLLVLISLLLVLLVYAQSGVTVDLVTTFNSPASGDWVNRLPVNLTFVAGGNNSAETGFNCSLWGNFKGNWNSTFVGGGIASGYNKSSIVPDTTLNFTIVTGLSENNTGFIWGVSCYNNLTGNLSVATFATNRTFKLDTVLPSVPKIATPANGSVIGSNNPYIEWLTSGDINFKRYTVQFANDSDFDTADIVKQQLININTTNATNFSESLEGNRIYYLRVLAEDEAGNTAWQFINTTIVSTVPTISIVKFDNGTFTNSAFPLFNITVTHQFIDRCEFYLTNRSLIGTFIANETSWTVNSTNASRSNGTMLFPPTSGMSNGSFKYGFRCNNTGGNFSTFTVNQTIIIDSDPPQPFGCIFPANKTISIDHTPELRWNVSTDNVTGVGGMQTFGYYTLYIDNNTDFSSPEFNKNYSTQDSNNNVTVDLRQFNKTDRGWYWKVNVTDKAGNTKESSNCTQFNYSTDITNHLLKNGWNIVSIMQSGTINASDLGNGIGATWATITRYNSSKGFVNYNNGTSTNANMSFQKGDVVFINLNADTYWENQTWDTSSAYTNNGLFNLTNTTGGWNVFGVQNQSGFTLGRIDWGIRLSNLQQGGLNGSTSGTAGGAYYYNVGGAFVNVTLPLNDSLQSLVYFNNSAVNTRKFVLHPFNYSKNNLTFVDFGEVVWININKSINGTSNLMIVNLSVIPSD